MLLLCSLVFQASALSSWPSCEEPPDLGFEAMNAVSLLQTDLSARAGARAPLSSRTPYALFVKFHKVAGGSLKVYVDALSRQSMRCSEHCGIPGWPEVAGTGKLQIDKYCPNEVPHSCGHHAGIEFALHAMARNQITPAHVNDLSNPANLMPESERYAELVHFAPASRAWLPDSWSSNSKLIVVTILRDPAEKFRSWYYWGWKGSKNSKDTLYEQLLSLNDTLANTSWEEIAQRDNSIVIKDSNIIRQCCEYAHYLGGGSVDKAKIVLATHFDLVGITERFDEVVVGLGKLYGVSVREIANIAKGPVAVYEKAYKDMSENKLDWTPQDYPLAKSLFAPEMSIYNFATELFDRQLGVLFDTTEAYDAALADFRHQSAAAGLEADLVKRFQHNKVKKPR
eukprot:TRINITY_DN4385_c0_g1_i1.p1 TRINITY_DN4385_c0_g1~~TRINITY_DN4385_c0_g1_i1.p1  ORF type:complete len:397 (+),score=64.28 TRINITY_DN4385_c0_g1_i1:82-1272(+)